jgi:[ribosomal protein S5]-alanine N-acetyltransferase
MFTPLTSLKLRKTLPADLEQLFEFQADPLSIRMAAFTPEHPEDKTAYLLKFINLLTHPLIHQQTILMDNKIIGSVAKFMMGEEAHITYGIAREYWGQGLATLALKQFLKLETTRPLFAHTAFDNIASQGVLEKNGFRKIASGYHYANARNATIEEYIYQLSSPASS